MIEFETRNPMPLQDKDGFPNIVKAYYDYFEENEREREVKDIPTFAPSYLTSCGRQLYYKKTGETPTNPIDLPSRFKMYLGTLAHEGLQLVMKDMGHVIESEEHHDIEYDGLGFNYFIDLVIDYNGEKVVIEIKTIYARGFDWIKERPKPEHILQTCSYMAFENIKKAIILYVGRDNGYMIQHNIESNGDLLLNGQKINEVRQEWKANMDRLKSIKQSIIDRNIPKPDHKRPLKVKNGIVSESFQHQGQRYNGFPCSYCQWKDKCQPVPQEDGIYV